MHKIYSYSEICVVVLFRTDLDFWLPDSSSTFFFRILTISLVDFGGKIHLAFEIRLSRYDPDASP